MKTFLTVLSFCLAALSGQSQVALEDVIVEVFYESDTNPFTGESQHVKTYRIYVDLKEGYSLQAVFGNVKHPLVIGSTGMIFNEPTRGVETGNWINARRLEYNGLFLDSFLTLSSVSNSFCGVLKSEDQNGSIYAEEESQMTGIGTYLDADMSGVSLREADGMVNCIPNNVQLVRMDASVFGSETFGQELTTNDGCWAAMGGVMGPTPSNKVLIAQVTTDGELYFEINLQVGLPEGGAEQYVASNASGNEVLNPKLALKK